MRAAAFATVLRVSHGRRPCRRQRGVVVYRANARVRSGIRRYAARVSHVRRLCRRQRGVVVYLASARVRGGI